MCTAWWGKGGVKDASAWLIVCGVLHKDHNASIGSMDYNLLFCDV